VLLLPLLNTQSALSISKRTNYSWLNTDWRVGISPELLTTSGDFSAS